MLGISFGEIMIIATIGLIVIGPKRLPETARFLGHLFGRVQRQVNSVKADIRREMALEDMKKIHREYEETARNVKNAFDQAATGVPPPETLPAPAPAEADTPPPPSDTPAAAAAPAAADDGQAAQTEDTKPAPAAPTPPAAS